MKKAFTFNPVSLLLLAWIAVLAVMMSCEKDDLDEDGTVSLREISTDPVFADLPLVGTKWKLVGFADDKTGRIKIAEVHSEGSKKYYTVSFEENGGFEFFSTGNTMTGDYIVKNADNQLLLDFGFRTLVGVTDEGKRFEDTIVKVDRFNLSPYGLSLYYSPSDYLLFQPFVE